MRLFMGLLAFRAMVAYVFEMNRVMAAIPNRVWPFMNRLEWMTETRMGTEMIWGLGGII